MLGQHTQRGLFCCLKGDTVPETLGRLLSIKSKAEVIADETTKRQLEAAKARVLAKPQTTELSAMVSDHWADAKTFRNESGIDTELLEAFEQANDTYSAADLAEIRDQGLPEIFMGLTGLKTRTALSMISDVFNSEVDRPWSLEPSPMPDLPPWVIENIKQRVLQDVMAAVQATGQPIPIEQIAAKAQDLRKAVDELLKSKADEKALAMEKLTWDQMLNGNWRSAFADVLTNICMLKAGILKGPVPRMSRRLQYHRIGGKVRAVVSPMIVHEWYSVSPFDCFPSRGSLSFRDGPFIERTRLSRRSLLDMIGMPGWDENAIKTVINQYGASGTTEPTQIDQQVSQIQGHGSDIKQREDILTALDYYGSASGEMLEKRGITKTPDGEPIHPIAEYDTNIIKIGEYVVYTAMNWHPLGERPYSKSGWSEIPGSFWYRGVPELMRDVQDIANASIRSMVSNASWASGPQVMINTARMMPGEDLGSLFPTKIWQTQASVGDPSNPISFYQPDMNARDLFFIYQQIQNLADEYTGVPSFAHGNDSIRGAGKTASGLGMLMSAASRGIKLVIARIHRELLGPSVNRQVQWNILYHPDDSVKGDLEVRAAGVLSHIAEAELANRRLSILQATLNPVDMQIMGLDGRANLLRTTIAQAGEMPEEQIARSQDDIRAQSAANDLTEGQSQAGAQPAVAGQQ